MNLALTLGTKNPGKLKEFEEMSRDCPWLELALAPADFDPEETGYTYIENAFIKARAAAEASGRLSAADDSGLEVDALEGRPGLYSARYSQGSDALGRAKLLKELEGEENRSARFVCAIVLCQPGSKEPVFQTEQYWTGRISLTEQGSQGFGFDPVFLPVGKDVTAAQISAKEKNLLSHRGQAWRQTLRFLEKNFINP